MILYPREKGLLRDHDYRSENKERDDLRTFYLPVQFFNRAQLKNISLRQPACMNREPDGTIRRLLSDEHIPYNLLLLADETTEAIDGYIHESEVYVIENEERFIAVYVLQPVDSSVVEIKNIAVDREYQGKGIGHSLLSDAQRRAREMGYSEIIIGTGDMATRQISLYESVGFKKYGIRKDFFLEKFPDPIFEDGVQLRDMVMLKIVL